MCGITGFIDFNKKSNQEILNLMVSTINHRGPDDRGLEIFDNELAQIGLAQARLSIIDLSNGGHQPMNFGDLSIVFNGEIYNYQEIKEKLMLLGHQFVTNSDTEVILHAFEQWGKEAVEHFIGMFAYFIYNKKNNKITITRDRAGVKPFYYYWDNDLFLFGSELKPFHSHPDFKKKIDVKALAGFFDFGYVAAPFTIFEKTSKLLPGHHLVIDLVQKTFVSEPYWQIETFYKMPKLKISYEEAKKQVHELLKSACNYRMVADVPVGVFLSGGYDSTIVTSILQSTSKEKLKTFTIGFHEGNNEAPFAKETARYLGTDNTEYICTTKEAQEIIPTLPFFFDEPFADSSAIPTILVSKLAVKKVTVALSADGGDEVFAGYSTYPSLTKNVNTINKIPDFLKPLVSKIGIMSLSLIPNEKVDLHHKLFGIFNSLNKNQNKQAEDLFRYMYSLSSKLQEKLFKEKVLSYSSPYKIDSSVFQDQKEFIAVAEYKNYLQNDILTKVDRATMSVSLEGREPLLDHHLIEYVAQLPLDFKWDGKTSKKILKDIVYQYVPKEMMDRPKTGFTLPIYTWLRGDLSYLLDEYLSPKALNSSGLFNTEWLNIQVELFKKDKFHYQPFMWKLLMFQMWHQKWMKD